MISLTPSRVTDSLDYDPDTGIFTWKFRAISDFPDGRAQASWNARLAGKKAGYYRPDGYCIITICNRRYLAHRLAWLLMRGHFPQQILDHINGDTSDNRINNLREVSIAQNAQNAALVARNKSGVTGVRWLGRDCRWRASITANCERIHLGEFQQFDEAVKARKSAEKALGFHQNHGRKRGDKHYSKPSLVEAAE